jgi:hypothetical protein
VRRRLAVVLVIAGLVSVAGCGDRSGTASPAPATPSAVATDDAGETGVAGVESAVTEAEELLASIDAELAEDGAEDGAG